MGLVSPGTELVSSSKSSSSISLFSYIQNSKYTALYIYIQILCRLASNTSWCPTRGTTCSIGSRKSLRASGQGDDDVDDDGQDVFVYLMSSVFVYTILFVFVFLVLIPIPARGGSSGQWQRGKWSDVLSACHPSLQQSYCCICIFIVFVEWFFNLLSITPLSNKASAVFLFCICYCICIYILYLHLLPATPLCSKAHTVFVLIVVFAGCILNFGLLLYWLSAAPHCNKAHQNIQIPKVLFCISYSRLCCVMVVISKS